MKSWRFRIHYGGVLVGILCVTVSILLGLLGARVLKAYALRRQNVYPPQVIRESEASVFERAYAERSSEAEASRSGEAARALSYGLRALSNRALGRSIEDTSPEREVGGGDAAAIVPTGNIPTGPFRVGVTAPIFDDGLIPGWEDWSWGSSRERVAMHQAPGDPEALLVSFKEHWSGLFFHTHAFLPQADDVLVFSMRTDEENPPALAVEFFEKPGEGLGALSVMDYLDGGAFVAGVWQDVRIPLRDLRAAWGTTTGFAIVSERPGEFFIDEIYITPGVPSSKFSPPPPSAPQPIALRTILGSPSSYHAAPLWRGWRALYGEHQFRDGVLTISTEAPQTATLIILEGSEHWRDYETAMRFNWHRGAQSVETIVRFEDERNYLACAWELHGTHLHAEIREWRDGEMLKISTWGGAVPLPYIESWRGIEMGVRIVGESVACLHDGEVVLRGRLPSDTGVYEGGGIAIKTWEPEAGQTILTIEDVAVFEVR